MGSTNLKINRYDSEFAKTIGFGSIRIWGCDCLVYESLRTSPAQNAEVVFAVLKRGSLWGV
jgi:hypothetical protein